jgi:hypothetical protein
MNLRGTEGRVGPKGPPYGRIQELGGEVRPVTRQWLTIPLEAAKTRAGVGRGRALDFQDTFFLRSRAGNLILAMKNGTGITPLFVLKKQVRVPASPYLSPVLAARRETIVAIMGDAYVAAVQP